MLSDADRKSLLGWIAMRPQCKGVTVHDETDVEVAAPPPPAPIDPPNVTRIGPARIAKSLDDVDLNGRKNWRYVLDVGAAIVVTRKQIIDKPGVTIESDVGGKTASIDCAGAMWKEAQYSLTKNAIGCTIQNVIIVGHDGAEFLHIDGTEGLMLKGVMQLAHPKHKGGITILTARNSKNLTVWGCSTERTARYGCYLGGDLNDAPRFEDLVFGPCAIVEDEHSSGKDKDKSNLHGGGWSEHCLRVYNFRNIVIQNCIFSNPNNADGKQACKLMSGDGGTVTKSTFNGSTRFGRDMNDPSDYTLKNLTITGCTFGEWVRIDPDANVTITDSTLPKYQVEPKGTLHLVNDKVGGQTVSKTIKK